MTHNAVLFFLLSCCLDSNTQSSLRTQALKMGEPHQLESMNNYMEKALPLLRDKLLLSLLSKK